MSHDRRPSGGQPGPIQARSCAHPAGRLRTAGTFLQDVRGFAAVEFGLVAPILVLLLIGALEVTRAVSIDRRLTVVTSMVADLVARDQLDENNNPLGFMDEDINAIYDIAELAMHPFNTDPLKISVIPLRSGSNGNIVRVYPVAAHRPSYNGGAVPAQCQPYSLAENFMKEKTSLIVVETSYDFTPLFGSFIMSSVTWKQKAFASPRRGCVEFYDKNKSKNEREKVCMSSTCFPS